MFGIAVYANSLGIQPPILGRLIDLMPTWAEAVRD
jgi:hypothetical protein